MLFPGNGPLQEPEEYLGKHNYNLRRSGLEPLRPPQCRAAGKYTRETFFDRGSATNLHGRPEHSLKSKADSCYSRPGRRDAACAIIESSGARATNPEGREPTMNESTIIHQYAAELVWCVESSPNAFAKVDLQAHFNKWVNFEIVNQ